MGCYVATYHMNCIELLGSRKSKPNIHRPATQPAAPIDKDQHFGYVFPDVAQTHARNVDPTGAFVNDIKAATTVDDLRAAMWHKPFFKQKLRTDKIMSARELAMSPGVAGHVCQP